MPLSDFDFSERYQKPNDDVAGFYRNCLSEAVNYDRLTGYFSRPVLVILWSAMIEFASRNGKIRLICSPLTEQDGEIIQRGYTARDDTALAHEIKTEFEQLLQKPELSDMAGALSGLVAERILDVKFAHLEPEAPAPVLRMVHDKTGIFRDSDGNQLAFSGSMNETYLGLSTDGNIESIDVYPDWLPDADRDRARTVSIARTFDDMWNGNLDGITVTPFPEASRLLLEEHARTARPWKEVAKELTAVEKSIREREPTPPPPPPPPPPLSLRPHQQEALDCWHQNDRRGVIAHATGAGKTITAIQAIRDHAESGGNALIIVPTTDLLKQWKEEIDRFTSPDQTIQQCGGGNTQWKRYLGPWLASDDPKVLIATTATARDPDFIYACNRHGSNLLIVGDEVHGLGATESSRIFGIEAVARLGLSATPERYDGGTQTILDYFGPTIHEYSLFEAIADGYLVEYQYHPVVVQLDDEEQIQWSAFSRSIGQAIARHGSLEKASRDPKFKLLLIRRSRIAKKASAKLEATRSIVSEYSEQGQRWLLYCEDQEQLNEVREEIRALSLPLPVYEFHSQMEGDRTATLEQFGDAGGIIASIRCLDEGIDIPDADNALILASSKNRRQFIQRRGRVLRLPSEGNTKDYALIHDVLVVPQPPVDPATDSLVLGEIGRALVFCQHASNHGCELALLTQLAGAGISLEDCEQFIGIGTDDDEGEGDESQEGTT